MSFGENLVYYRKRLKITQEELAERLYVSRQTVSRWENDSFYPDMDTLIKLCDIFDCSMDTLVRGSAVDDCSTVNAVDSFTINEYDRHMNKFSFFISIGVFLIILGISLLISLSSFVSEILGVVIFMLLLSCAVSTFIVAGISHDNFMKLNPHIEAYPKHISNKFMRKFPFYIAGATLLIFMGVIMLIIMLYKEGYAPSGFTVSTWESLAVSLFMLIISIAVFLYVYFCIQHSKYNVNLYNEECIKEGYNTDELTEQQKKKSQLEEGICGIIMTLATIVFLLLGFIGNLWHPAWITFPIGGALCSIVSVIFKSTSKK